MERKIQYEQPLNEYIRSYLRLEHLFLQIKNNLKHDNATGYFHALCSVIETTQLLDRSDIKTQLGKSLNLFVQKLTSLQNNPHINSEKLSEILNQLVHYEDELKTQPGRIGQKLRENEFLNSVRNQISVPGGGCDFDIPILHHWLQQPSETCRADIDNWLLDLSLVNDGSRLILSLLRESVTAQQKIADQGFYQEILNRNNNYQLVCIELDQSSPYYPEVSLSKHQIYVRFFTASTQGKSDQTDQDVNFKLSYCTI